METATRPITFQVVIISGLTAFIPAITATPPTTTDRTMVPASIGCPTPATQTPMGRTTAPAVSTATRITIPAGMATTAPDIALIAMATMLTAMGVIQAIAGVMTVIMTSFVMIQFQQGQADHSEIAPCLLPERNCRNQSLWRC